MSIFDNFKDIRSRMLGELKPSPKPTPINPAPDYITCSRCMAGYDKVDHTCPFCGATN